MHVGFDTDFLSRRVTYAQATCIGYFAPRAIEARILYQVNKKKCSRRSGLAPLSLSGRSSVLGRRVSLRVWSRT